MVLRHPLSGAVYSQTADRTVHVVGGGGEGIFDGEGRWLSGERRWADPEMCRWIADEAPRAAEEGSGRQVQPWEDEARQPRRHHHDSPPLLPGLADVNSQYDAFKNFSRAMTASAVPSPHLRETPSEEQVLKSALGTWDDEEPPLRPPTGARARPALAASLREIRRDAFGDRVDALSDAEMIDAIYYTVFPNFHPWGGLFTLLTYRFRPFGNDPTKSIMDCMVLTPFQGERPPAVPVHWLGEDDDWLSAPELGTLANVFMQDTHNIKRIHAGLQSSHRGNVTFSRYQELKIRHFYHLYGSDLGLVAAGERKVQC